ncbi:MAG: TolC family protein [Xanthomonadales bacterium]|nr:TolC family protein [Xanthomonadales bacterium]
MLSFLLPRGLSTVRTRRWRAALLASICAVCSPLALAAPNDLADAVRAAWLAHPGATATEQTLIAARARAEAAGRPLYNPELEFAVDDEGDDRTTTAGVGLTLDLFGKRRARAAAGDASLSLAIAEAELRRATFAQAWLKAWADRRAAQHRVQLGAQRVNLVQRFADLAGKQQQVGDISSLERDLALLARDETLAEQATLLADAATADEAFRVVGGAPERDDASNSGDVPPALAPDNDRLGNVPEQQIALAQSLQAERRITVAERDRRPDPTVSLRGGQVDLGPTSDNVIGLTVSVPLFVRNGYRAEATAARAEHSATSAEQQLVTLQVEARAERARKTYTAVREAWALWSKSPGTDVDTRASLLERLWRAGEISTADFLIQLQQTLDTSLAGADLQGRVWRAYVDALYATGHLNAWIGFDPSVSEVNP